MPNLLWQACRLLPGGLARQFSMARPLEDFSMAFVTAPNTDKAKEIAGGLVSNKLAACVNIVPGVTSVYEWEGKIENDSEVLMMIKTRTSRIEELTEFVKSKSGEQSKNSLTMISSFQRIIPTTCVRSLLLQSRVGTKSTLTGSGKLFLRLKCDENNLYFYIQIE